VRPDPAATDGRPLRIATWNIHSAVGLDRRYDAARIVDVLEEIDADVIALQEVPSLEDHGEFVGMLRSRLAMHVVAGRTLSRAGADYGNALLSRLPVTATSRIDLTVHVREPRGALDAHLECGGQRLRVLNTHLGLRPYERRQQVRRLLAAIDAGPMAPLVLMGDVNEWFLWGRPLRWLHADFHSRPAPATFPSRMPILALDRIWLRPEPMLRRLVPHHSARTRVASDHLPLVAVIVVPIAVAPRAPPPQPADAAPVRATGD